MHRRNLLKLLLVVAMVAPLGACKTVRTTQGGAVGVDRQQTMSALVSTRQLEQGAVQAYRQALTQASQKGQLNRDPALTARVRAIAQRLIPHTGVFRQDAPGWNWEVNVIASPEVNAWCMPGGKIAVYAGLVQKLDATDDEIAAVIGHEIAHALREKSPRSSAMRSPTRCANIRASGPRSRSTPELSPRAWVWRSAAARAAWIWPAWWPT